MFNEMPVGVPYLLLGVFLLYNGLLLAGLLRSLRPARGKGGCAYCGGSLSRDPIKAIAISGKETYYVYKCQHCDEQIILTALYRA